MSVVNVNTETLKAGSISVKKIYNDNKVYYDAVSSKFITNCRTFDSFKDGVITEILVANEEVVDYGKGLVRIK